MKENLTHARAWKKNPSKKGYFVSEFVHHTFPILDKNKKIKKVLDVACGNGVGVTLPLLRRGLDVCCFDHTLSAINAVKKNAKKESFKVHTKKADMFKKFPYKSKSFDATFFFQAIYHGKLDQIIFSLSEVKRVTKKNGYFFGTFMRYDMIHFDKKKKKYYINVQLPNKKIRNWHKQDKRDPNLFYYLSKDFEYMQPHYYFKKEELKSVLSRYFSDIKIKKVHWSADNFAEFWFISAKIK